MPAHFVWNMTAKSSKFLNNLPGSFLEKCFLFLTVEDLLSLKLAFPELTERIRAYICSKRTLHFMVTAQNRVAGCWSNRFMLSYKSVHSKPKKETKPVVDSERGWGKLWNKKLLGGLQSYANLRSLKLYASGNSGGGFLLKPKWLKKLSETLPNIQSLSIFHAVLFSPGDTGSYEGPVGLYKVRVANMNLKNWDKICGGLKFPTLKTLKLGYPTKGVMDLLAQPGVVPNLERLFVMSRIYLADECLERFTRYNNSKLKEFMHIPSKCRLPRQTGARPTTDGNAPTQPGTALLEFLQTHKNQLEAFCFDPVPEKLMFQLMNLLSEMPKLRKLALCIENPHSPVEPRSAAKTVSQDERETLSNKGIACRNIENLFLDCGPSFPEFWLSAILRSNFWSLRTLKVWNCPSLTAESSLMEIRKCQNLEKLEFSRVKNLDSGTLQAILESSGSKLRVLIVRCCPKVYKSSVTCITQLECPNLEKFLFNSGRQQAFDEHL